MSRQASPTTIGAFVLGAPVLWGQDYQALAAAMSRTVAHLSQDIAAAITTLEQKGSPS